MRTLTLDVRPPSEALADFSRAWQTGEGDADPRVSFATPELLWSVLTAKRWELLKAMAGQEAMTLREASRRVGRDVKGVHGDVHALLDAGVLRKTDNGRIVFPFDAVRVVFLLRAA